MEEIGRIVRYKAFYKIQQELKADYIAVAHHKNDQAETVLHNLCRGSGIAGLAGMAAKQNGIIRPLLCVEKEEIEEYLKIKGQPYQIDSTNFDNSYKRNRWRNEIIPLMRTKINAQTISHISDTALIMGEVDDFVKQYGKCAWERMIETKEKNFFRFRKMEKGTYSYSKMDCTEYDVSVVWYAKGYWTSTCVGYNGAGRKTSGKMHSSSL